MFSSILHIFWVVIVGWMVVLGTASCSKKEHSEWKAPAYLPRIPSNHGTACNPEVTFRVQDRQLVLPSGKQCRRGDSSCTKELQNLAGKKLALELESSLVMAELSEPFATLSQIMEDEKAICLVVADSQSCRCIPFFPYGADDFAEWLDAEKPVGKIRVVMRSDGLEVVADRGKVPGPDRFGPSLPSLGARPDYDGLDRVMGAMARRFPYEDTAGLLPSVGMRVEEVARVMAILSGVNASRFSTLILVYP